MRSQILPVILGLNTATGFAKVSYDGAKAMRIPTGEDVTPLLDIINKLSLPTWKGIANGVPVANSHVDLVVPAEQVDEFNKLMGSMPVEVMHEDLGASIADEGTMAAYAGELRISDSLMAKLTKDYPAGTPNATWFNSYHAYADHLQFLTDLTTTYPTQSEIITSGTSVQGRVITGIHFWGSGGKGSKPAVVFHSTVHAREWITTMVTEYFIYNLLTNYGSSTEIKGFVDKYDFYIFPVVNPDGFVYSQTTDRLWRKNRQTISTNTCVGRDINRNWPLQWSLTGGASTDPCAEDYKGKVVRQAAGDAPENKALLAYINNLAAGKGVQLYIDIHSYSQLFMTPYGYSCTAVTANNAVLQSLAKSTAAAIQAVYGTKYQYGPICSTIYKVTGGSVDYVNDVTKSKYVFTIELRDTGSNGFVLPASQILPSAVETYAGLRNLLINMV
ncbi:Metallocarboxypeptidase A-like protein [Lachnellula suecica]|uniref:Metallocarboxypeptidase A-like protein n=1 Tax=Lachnellula suecica TaxID=602035 RepID=A0A8T9C7G9_9HELO|nr:Metallocarboxypeptidase A-like protein [Lachnellula suecica]